MPPIERWAMARDSPPLLPCPDGQAVVASRTEPPLAGWFLAWPGLTGGFAYRRLHALETRNTPAVKVLSCGQRYRDEGVYKPSTLTAGMSRALVTARRHANAPVWNGR